MTITLETINILKMASWFTRINKSTVIWTVVLLLISVFILMYALRIKELNVEGHLKESYREVGTTPTPQALPLFDVEYDEVIFAPSYTSGRDFSGLDGYEWNFLLPERISLHSMNEGHIIVLFVKNKKVFAFAEVPNKPIDFGALWDTNGLMGFVPFTREEFGALHYKKVEGRGAIPVLENRLKVKL